MVGISPRGESLFPVTCCRFGHNGSLTECTSDSEWGFSRDFLFSSLGYMCQPVPSFLSSMPAEHVTQDEERESLALGDKPQGENPALHARVEPEGFPLNLLPHGGPLDGRVFRP